jgi:hypothetical protein
MIVFDIKLTNVNKSYHYSFNRSILLIDLFLIIIDKNIVTTAKINIQRIILTKDSDDGKETAF